MANLSSVLPVASQALTSVLGGKTKVQFIQNNKTVITLDASISETHSRQSPPTEFPVESGPVISDHILMKPIELEITGIISDSPIGGLNGLLTEAATSLTSALLPPSTVTALAGAVSLVSAIAGSSSPSVAAYNNLMGLQQAGQPMDVLTTLYRYSNMFIKNISVPRDAANGKCLLFTVQMIQLLIVQTQTVNVQIFADPALAAGSANTGTQATSQVNGASVGYADSQTAIKTVSSNGLNGGTQ